MSLSKTIMEENDQKPKVENKKDLLKNWGYIVFVTGCTISFFVALVFVLDFPLKFALLLGLIPVGTFFALLILFFCVFKWDFNKWRENYDSVFINENYTRAIKSFLLPLLLVGLYFYIREEEESMNILYASSPVTCDMIIHPCGSSFERGSLNSVWDAADLISQHSENEVFIVTNAVVSNQHRGVCGQTGAYCSTDNINPGRRTPNWLKNSGWIFLHGYSRAQIWNPISCPDVQVCEPGILYDNGIQAEECEETGRFCSIYGWCPPIKLDDFRPEPVFETEDFTIFLDLKPNFTKFHEVSWSKGGKYGYSANYAEIYAQYHKYSRAVSSCVYHPRDDQYCPRFRLQDIVTLAFADGNSSNFKETATYGGMFKVEVEWKCKFDWGKDIFDCLPNFKFLNRASNKGKPKIYPKVTSQVGNNRTVSYSLGINISIAHVGLGQQIQIFGLVLYAQFIFVSFQMIKNPFIWVVRCIIATFLTARGK